MDPSLTQLARIARTKTFAALRVVLCAVVLLAVQSSLVHAQHAAIPTRLDIDRQTETVALPALQAPALRLRAALPTGGGEAAGKPLPVPGGPVWQVPATVTAAEFTQPPRRVHEVSATLRSGRGPPV